MAHEAAPVRRGRGLSTRGDGPDGPAPLRDPPGITIAFARTSRRLAIARAARDAHRSDCDLDAVECDTCRAHAAAIANAKFALREERA